MKYTEKQVSVPLCAVSTSSGLLNRTGSWKFAEPVFIDRVSPCNLQCPAGEDITGYMYLASQKRFEEAWRLITQENPFPAIMGRICFHPCEGECNRKDHDEAVAIHMVERFIGDYGLSNKLKISVSEPDKDRKIAVVGAGPAGLSAAFHARRMGYPVTVYDSNERPGGLMRYGIPPSRLPKDILDGEVQRLYEMGIEFKMGVTVGKDISWEELKSTYDALFFALGAYEEQALEIKGIDKAGVFHALAFLKEINLGKKPAIGKHMAVIGGGNSAIDCARASRRLGATVTIVYRRSEAEMPAHPEEVAMAKEEGIQFLFLATPQEVHGGKAVTGMKLEKMALGEPDDSGRRRPVPTGETVDIDCDGMIMAIGEYTRIDDLPSFVSHTQGVVTTDPMGKTSDPSVFAGGDIIDIPHTVTHGIGSGKRAALALDRLLQGGFGDHGDLDQFRWGEKGMISIGRMRGTALFKRRNPSPDVAEYKGLNAFYFDHRPRMKIHAIPLEKRVTGFQEVIESPSQQEAVSEAARCFNCGSCTECGNCYIFCPECAIKRDPGGYGYYADMDYCKGCGICVYECPRGAMKMKYME
jgi:NADPH-dependent glutamate synthase beta subunit-like oxidoreductase/Pyruvate/2-oxoacid:ferredoxin oxidoreductase delta subunit